MNMARPKGHRLSPTAWSDFLNLRGLTLTEAAKLADLQRATISGLVGGHARASVPMAHAISAALGLHPETLFPTLRSSLYSEVEAA